VKDLWPYINLQTFVRDVKYLEEERKFLVTVEGKFAKKKRADFDHTMPAEEAFEGVVQQAVPLSTEGRLVTYKVDRVAICSGSNQVKAAPDWQGLESFEGTVTHSSEYKSNEPFVGKKVVLVGAGESGSDIAYMISCVASQAWISIRSHPGFIIPRQLLGTVSDLDTSRLRHSLCAKMQGWLTNMRNKQMRMGVRIGKLPGWWSKVADLNEGTGIKIVSQYGTKSEGLPRALHENGLQMKPDILRVRPRSVVFTDGSEVECDHIVANIGYRPALPYLEASMGKWLNPVRTPCGGGVDPRRLYKNVFHPDMEGRMAWVGYARPCFGAIPPLAEMQARLFAMVCSGEVELPSAENMHKLATADRAFWLDLLGKNGERIKSLVNHVTYADSLAEIMGCKPNLWRLFLTSPRAMWGAWLGPIGCTQYRLYGPHNRHEQALEVMKGMEVPVPRVWFPCLVMTAIGYLLSCLGFSEYYPQGIIGGTNATQPYRRTYMEHAKLPDLDADRKKHAQVVEAKKREKISQYEKWYKEAAPIEADL